MNKKFWKSMPAWAVVDKDYNLLYTDNEACVYESYSAAEKEKGSHHIAAVEIFVRKFWKSMPAWAVVDKDYNLLYTDNEACVYESYSAAEKEKGSHHIAAVEIFVRKKLK